MKLGVMAVLFGDKDLKWVCDFLVSKGVQTIEIGCRRLPPARQSAIPTSS